MYHDPTDDRWHNDDGTLVVSTAADQSKPGGGADPSKGDPANANRIPIPANINIPGPYSPTYPQAGARGIDPSTYSKPNLGSAPASGANISPYQQGQGLAPGTFGNLKQGMNLAQQSYNKLGQTGDQMMREANFADDAAYNPAIGAFQKATNQNTMQVASALASQRGSAVNPGMVARNIGVAGATAQQEAVGQMASMVAQYRSSQEQNALQAFSQQGQMAGVYGAIAGKYADASLTNQGQILNAIAAQNAAKVAMQSNINTSNVAMQSNINNAMTAMDSSINSNIVNMQSNVNNANVAMQSNLNSVAGAQNIAQIQAQLGKYNADLGYTSAIYGDQTSQSIAQGQQNQSFWGSVAQGAGTGLSILASFLNKGGQVHADGSATTTNKYSKGGLVKGNWQNAPKYANGGRIPDKKRKKMADGGQAGDEYHLLDQSQSLGGTSSPGVPLNLDGVPIGSSNNPGADAAGSNIKKPASIIGRFLQGWGKSMGNISPIGLFNPNTNPGLSNGVQNLGMGLGALMGKESGEGGFGESAGIPNGGMSRGGPVRRYAPGGEVAPGINNTGPMIPNLGLMGSPNPNVAMPPTGLPMGNAQTRGGGPMPAPGKNGGAPMNKGGRVQKLWGGGFSHGGGGQPAQGGSNGGGNSNPGPAAPPANPGGFTAMTQPFQNNDYLTPGFEAVGSGFQGNPWAPSGQINQGAIALGLVGSNGQPPTPPPPIGGGGHGDGDHDRDDRWFGDGSGGHQGGWGGEGFPGGGTFPGTNQQGADANAGGQRFMGPPTRVGEEPWWRWGGGSNWAGTPLFAQGGRVGYSMGDFVDPNSNTPYAYPQAWSRNKAAPQTQNTSMPQFNQIPASTGSVGLNMNNNNQNSYTPIDGPGSTPSPTAGKTNLDYTQQGGYSRPMMQMQNQGQQGQQYQDQGQGQSQDQQMNPQLSQLLQYLLQQQQAGQQSQMQQQQMQGFNMARPNPRMMFAGMPGSARSRQQFMTPQAVDPRMLYAGMQQQQQPMARGGVAMKTNSPRVIMIPAGGVRRLN